MSSVPRNIPVRKLDVEKCYPSKLGKHEDSHVKLDAVEALCSEPGCMKYFTNKQCLMEHLLSCHQYIACELCGAKQLKKNIKRHLRTHEVGISSERIRCSFDGCVHKFSNPFTCTVPGCGMKFAFKHVRDNHDKSGCHVYTQGNFEEANEQFQLRSRGGRKRKYPVIETLMRKRVIPPSESDPVMREGPQYLSWLLDAESED
ncbi:unnamed protein product [Fraxinus pennsylvanica]|uniref:C2H2-type domain-containing protein n=1 Tax=Fraxinus pennsylvanica TaxID=56036 RepID=A0AAD2A613_9LAMI|nr:unnamed protein product [Fraxinus pennsylvanica]